MASEVAIRAIRAGEAARLKAIRLDALADSPGSFGALYADEAALPASAWEERTARSAEGLANITFLAEDGLDWVGMVAAQVSTDDAGRVGLFGLWVAPSARGLGVGLRLTQAVVEWAGSRGAARVVLWVIEPNPRAVAVYLRAGFAETGNRKSLRRDESVGELEMARQLG